MNALITGVSGQDGSYLTEYLLEKGYKVYGLIRRKSVVQEQASRIQPLIDSGVVETVYGDMTDETSLRQALRVIRPDLIFNLAAQSQVHISFKIPIYTVEVNALGVLKLLEAMKEYVPNSRLYQSTSSENFGNTIDSDGFQRETTSMNPVSPYGIAKLAAYHFVRHYRKAYNLFACQGVLFNHCSPRRSSNFVEQKIVQNAVKIKYGKTKELKLGNIDTYRDFGHSYDYVRAMYRILQHNEPDDFVIASGETYSIRDICKMVFDYLDLSYLDYVKSDTQYIRPHELNKLKGDASKAKSILKWKPTYTFQETLNEMIQCAKLDLQNGKI